MFRTLSFQAACVACLCVSNASAGDGCHRSHGGSYRSPVASHPFVRPAPIGQPTYHTVVPTVVQRATVPQPVVTAPVAQPVAAAAPQQPAQPSPAERTAAALQAFRLGNNHEAKLIVDRLLETAPNNSDLRQFRSLIHLRSGELRAAAFDAYEALKLGRLWTAQQVESVYGDAQRYQHDLRLLQLPASSGDQDMALPFLAAYHHLIAGQSALAQTALQRVLQIQPAEPVATALVRLITAKSDTASTTVQTASVQ